MRGDAFGVRESAVVLVVTDLTAETGLVGVPAVVGVFGDGGGGVVGETLRGGVERILSVSVERVEWGDGDVVRRLVCWCIMREGVVLS